jgi:hypothetical protein
MKPVRMWLGLLLVTLGTFGMMDVLGILSWNETVSRWWPAAIIALGLTTMAGERRISFGPSLVAGIGALLLLGRLDLMNASAVGPIVLIGIGLAIFVSSVNGSTPAGRTAGRPSIALFGASEIKNRSEHLRHADVSAIFGGATLDLREAHIDDRAVVDATALFGGVDVLVPEGWRVQIGGIPIFGGFEDKTNNQAPPAPGAPTLRVNATSIFGGVTVANKAG